MTRRTIDIEYFNWMWHLVRPGAPRRRKTYNRLLLYLHETEFVYSIQNDANRAADGINLRYRFAYDYAGIEDAENYISGPCSILEMLIALSLRCEEHIMDDPDIGDRTSQWFWLMIFNLGLDSMSDDKFNIGYVQERVSAFLNREYEPNGVGGLFVVENCRRDLRTVEIWYQMCWYLSSLL